MNRALWIKEWTQMALLRWIGVGLGLFVPPGLWSIARLAEKGWIPLVTRGTTYDAGELLREPAAAVFVVAWGVLALLFGSQVLSADRGAGTDTFLLAAPVSRRRSWSVKIAAAIGATLAIVVAHSIYWFFLHSLFAGELEFIGFDSRVQLVALLAIVCGSSGGVSAAGLVRAPMHVLPIGLVLALAPLGVGALLVSAFPMPRVGTWDQSIALGLLVALIIPFGLFVVSYLAEVRGEPAGRRRWRRALIGVVVTLLLPVGLFLATASSVLRSHIEPYSLRVQPNGPSVAAVDPDGGYVRNLETGSTFYLPPPLWDAQWNAEGTTIAICHSAGPLGSLLKHDRLDFRGPDGEAVGGAVESPRGCTPMLWAGDRLVVREYTYPLQELAIIDPVRGSRQTIPAEKFGAEWVSPNLFRREEDGAVFILRPAPGETVPVEVVEKYRNRSHRPVDPMELRRALAEPIRLELAQVDPAEARVSSQPAYSFEMRVLDLVAPRPGQNYAPYLQRFWRFAPGGEGADADEFADFVDIETGERFRLPHTKDDVIVWLDDERFIAKRSKIGKRRHRLTVTPFDPELHALAGPPIVDRTWDHQVHLRPSPDRRRLMVSVFYDETESDETSAGEAWLFRAADASWADLAEIGPRSDWVTNTEIVIRKARRSRTLPNGRILGDSFTALYDVDHGTMRELEGPD